MKIDKETKKQIKDYFSSKKFIVAMAIFLLAAGTGIGTAMSVSRQIEKIKNPKKRRRFHVSVLFFSVTPRGYSF